ncbi:MAG: hypothetical protein VYB65_00235 [Myxococcota bacterium]|nr:hypothetical protein [Myxococcota bacterium]
MRKLGLILVMVACSEPIAEPTGFSGLGARCGPTQPCAEGLRCAGGLCLAAVRDGGAALEDVGSSPMDAGEATDTGSSPAHDAGAERVVGVQWARPDGRVSIEEGERLDAAVEVSGDDLSGLTLRWSSSLDGVIGDDQIPPTGRVVRSILLRERGVHELRVEVLDGERSLADATRRVGVCGWQVIGDFNADLEGWQRFGDAQRDPRGWLELTGNARGRKGAIYKVSESIEPGNVQLAFRISTGQCDEPGPCQFNANNAADGFAMNIWDVESPEALADLFDVASTGGGLAYGVGGAWGDWVGNAFHIEFDTWYNQFNGGNEFHTDPTRQNHVAITLDGDPGNHVAVAETPAIEDNAWHEVELVIRGDRVRVDLDGRSVIDQRVEGLDFKGGYIGFSGTTGYYTNFHRFDDLRTRPACEP